MPAEEKLPSQQLISVDHIRDGVVIIRGGGLRVVLLSTGLNFALLSEPEQQAVITGFQSFLASLDFSIQFVAHSRRINIDAYVADIARQTQSESNDLLRLQSQEYVSFVKSFVELYSVMDKKFFIVVPFNPQVSTEAVKGGVMQFIKRGKSPVVETNYTNEEFEHYVRQLEARRDHVVSGLARMGINVVPLGTEELIELYYNFYNPIAKEKEVKSGFREQEDLGDLTKGVQ